MIEFRKYLKSEYEKIISDQNMIDGIEYMKNIGATEISAICVLEACEGISYEKAASAIEKTGFWNEEQAVIDQNTIDFIEALRSPERLDLEED